jgi:hypothetical protein
MLHVEWLKGYPDNGKILFKLSEKQASFTKLHIPHQKIAFFQNNPKTTDLT